MSQKLMRRFFANSIFEIALAGLFIALWTVSAAYLKIDFGPMKAGIYLAFAILAGLIFKPLMAFTIGLIADNLQLLLTGNTWSWLFALLPLIIVGATLFGKLIFKIKHQTWWIIITTSGMFGVLGILLLLLLLNPEFSHSDQGKTLDFTAFSTKLLVWLAFGLFALIFGFLELYYYWRVKHQKNIKKLQNLINLTLIVTFVYIIASWVIGPIASIIWLNQIGGTTHQHGRHTSYYWRLYDPFLIIRIIKTPISLPLQIFIVFGIYQVFETLNSGQKTKWL